MRPEQASDRLNDIADRLDRSQRPSLRAVVAALTELALEIEGGPAPAEPVASSKPDMAGVIGDVDYISYGGSVVLTDGTVDIIEPPDDEDEPGAKWTIYRLMADQVDPSGEWFGDGLDGVAKTVGADPAELAARFQSEDVMERASAYLDVVAVHGAHNFDESPLQLTREEVEARYPD